MTGKSFRVMLSNGEEKTINNTFVTKSEDGALIFNYTDTTHIYASGKWEYVEEIETEDKS